MSHSVHNFNAGPAVLPRPVLERVQAELLDYGGTGMSVMEMSHRSSTFEGILGQAEADLRQLLGLGADYQVLFLQGGATGQFAMAPLNLRAEGQSADYTLTGAWAKAAFKEARRLGSCRVAASTEPGGFNRVPAQAELDLDPNAAYLHFTSNETIHGIEWSDEPQPPAGVPLVCDMSSDILSRPFDASRYGLIYAGAQKNLGPSGVTVVIVRQELLQRTPGNLPIMLDYRLQAENRSLYNTPPVFAIYIVGLVLRWILDLGGLGAMAERNRAKAERLYEVLDQSGGFYRGHAEAGSRSRMNVTFRLPGEAAEAAFFKQASAEGFVGLKGHRSLGGARASLYNALPPESVEALAGFMREFQRQTE
jgi:phosphoserine aminotransferase